MSNISIAALREAATSGKTYAEVAEAHGTTRSAVAGRARRLGVTFPIGDKLRRHRDFRHHSWASLLSLLAKLSPEQRETVRRTATDLLTDGAGLRGPASTTDGAEVQRSGGITS